MKEWGKKREKKMSYTQSLKNLGEFSVKMPSLKVGKKKSEEKQQVNDKMMIFFLFITCDPEQYIKKNECKVYVCKFVDSWCLCVSLLTLCFLCGHENCVYHGTG